MLVLNVSSVAVLWFGGAPRGRRADAGRRADRVPRLPPADPDVGHDGHLHGDDGPAGRGLRRAHRRGARHRVSVGAAGAARDAAAARRAGWSSSGVGFRYPGAAAPVLRDISLHAPARADHGRRRQHRRGQDHAAVAGAPAGRRDGGSRAGRRRRRARPRARAAVAPDRPGAAAAVPVHRAPSRRTCATAIPTRPTTSCGRRWRSRRPATSSRPCRAGWTRRSRRAARTSPAASGSGWRSPGRWSAGRRSTCSTTRSPRSTWPPTPGCGPRWRRSRPPRPWSIVAQRVSTIIDADQIVVLEDGAVVGRRHARRAARDLPDLRGDRGVPARPRRRRHEHRPATRRRPRRRARRRGPREPPAAAGGGPWPHRPAEKSMNFGPSARRLLRRLAPSGRGRSSSRSASPSVALSVDRPEAARARHRPDLRRRDRGGCPPAAPRAGGRRGAPRATTARRHARGTGRRARPGHRLRRARPGAAARRSRSTWRRRCSAGCRATCSTASCSARSAGCAPTSRTSSTGCRCATSTASRAASCSAASPTTSTTSRRACSRP